MRFIIKRIVVNDIMVNNAGVGSTMKLFHEEDWQAWDQIIAVNLRGVASGIKHVLPHMLQQGYGRIINTASQLAHKPHASHLNLSEGAPLIPA